MTINRLSVGILTIAVLFTISAFSIQDAHATDRTISGPSSCADIGGSWSDPFCSVTSLTINSGDTLTVGPSPVRFKDIILYNTGTLTINSGGTLTSFAGNFDNGPSTIVNAGGTINNHGTLNNNGGGLTNAPGTINNDGTINNYNSGYFLSYAVGTINNNVGGTIDNSATINMDVGGALNNFGSIINSGDIGIQCGATYSGNPSAPNGVIFVCIDNDFDGIVNELDTMPDTASNSFADDDPAPITSGDITDRGDQDILITEEPDDDGVRIRAETEGGPTPATINVCNNSMTLSLGSEGETIVTCASVDIQVVSGPIDISFTDGTTTGTSTLNTGDSLVFDPASFSVTNNGDTSIIIIVNDIPFEIPPGATFPHLDDDNDGIANFLDTSPLVFSNSFADDDPEPITSGDIITRGDEIVTITDETDPQGVRIRANLVSGGTGAPTPARINVCNNAASFLFFPTSDFIVTCDSVDIQVISGPIDITFTDGTTTGSSTLNTGDSIVFDPTSFSVTNNGDTPVIIIINGDQIRIPPGETFSSGPPSQAVGGTLIPIDKTSLLLAGAQSFSWMIPVVLSIVGIGLVLVKRK